MLLDFEGLSPNIHPSAFIAPGAMIIGDVSIGEDSGIWFNCVLRGDIDRIEVGARSNIQDGTVIHLDSGIPTIVGDDVTIGHAAIIHACTISDGALIGMGAIVLSGAKIGEEAIVAAGTLVREGQEIPPRSVAMGVPAKVRRETTEEDLERMRENAAGYARRGTVMRKTIGNTQR
ncbi:MAG: gamma carbonic anhydrase family protein [Candidatus Poribacteria bacterium]|nr:gamma carbonic anhydrase family protein [Candidatus Poribacteria bacterium]MDE0505378.1 gamma carbonic anhydrase family protein [Candidatus Poribacteria bacterium]